VKWRRAARWSVVSAPTPELAALITLSGMGLRMMKLKRIKDKNQIEGSRNKTNEERAYM
jgi:hypothetical protein